MPKSLPSGNVGRMLREIRERQGLTREDLALASGVSVTAISDLELGVTLRPHRETAQKLARALNLTEAEKAAFEAARRGGSAYGAAPSPSKPPQHDPVSTESEVALPSAGPRAVQSGATRALPYPIRSFVGREEELTELIGVLSGTDGTRVCVIEGMPGVGKTALAVQAAHQVAGNFPDGQFFIDLHGYTRGLRPLSPKEALRSLLQNCLGIPNESIPRTLDERAAIYRSLLAKTRTLILLDNATSPAQVMPLLPGDPGCAIIVTSRRSLRGLEDEESLVLGTLPIDEAVELFRKTAGTKRLTAGDFELRQIVQLCEGLPLAVRMIAAWMRRRPLLTTAEVLVQLRDERQRLRHLQYEDLGVRAAFELSYGRLPDAEQRMFRRLGLIPGSDFDVHVAASLIRGDAWHLLESLLDHNLLLQQAPGRYRLHDLARAYARDLAANEAAEVSGHLLDFYLYEARTADVHFERRSPEPNSVSLVGMPLSAPLLATAEQARTWISAELANLHAAARYAASTGRPGFAISLSMALAQYLRVYGPWPQGLLLHRLARATALKSGDFDGQAAALVHIGVLHTQLAEFSRAKVALDQAVGLYRRLGNRHGLAAALLESGVIKRLSGMMKESGKDLTEALALYRELDDQHGEAGSLAELGDLHQQTSQFGLALENLKQALRLFHDLRMPYGVATTFGYLGRVQSTTGETEDAEVSLKSALEIYRERGDSIGQANILMQLGNVYRTTGRLEKAVLTLDESRSLYEALGHRRGVAGVLTYVGHARQLEGNPEAADKALSEALKIFSEVGDPGGEVEALNHYARLAMAKGKTGEALTRYEQALELARRIGSRKDEADALEGIARVHLFASDMPKARAAYERAHGLYELMNLDKDADRTRQALTRISKEA